jgi:Ca2+-binding RTX toxin-like protein
LQGGNDNIRLADRPTINAMIKAGNGNDKVTLGNGNNTVMLGNGNDNVQAGNGNNKITVGNGNDLRMSRRSRAGRQHRQHAEDHGNRERQDGNQGQALLRHHSEVTRPARLVKKTRTLA